jgi:hypothetical protein
MKKKKERKKERETHTKVIWPMGWWVGLSLLVSPRARPISCLENPNPLANLYHLGQVKSAPQATCERQVSFTHVLFVGSHELRVIQLAHCTLLLYFIYLLLLLFHFS